MKVNIFSCFRNNFCSAVKVVQSVTKKEREKGRKKERKKEREKESKKERKKERKEEKVKVLEIQFTVKGAERLREC